jgi:hypothetical protein
VSPALTRFDRWLRRRFTEVNTELEEIYFAARAPLVRGDPHVAGLHRALVEDGNALIASVLAGPLPTATIGDTNCLAASGTSWAHAGVTRSATRWPTRPA